MLSLAVFVSGTGSNLKTLIDTPAGQMQASVDLVVADRPCKAQQHALVHNIPYIEHRRPFATAQSDIMAALETHHIDLIVLAGYLSVLPKDFCQSWASRIINLHPSLLPRHGGKGMWGQRVHQAVLDAKDTMSGVTIHHVTAQIDQGDIIQQASCPVHSDDNAQSLARRVQALEHQILPKTIRDLSHQILASERNREAL